MSQILLKLDDYKRKNPRILKPFHQFGIGCPLRLRVNIYIGCAFDCKFCYIHNKQGEPRAYGEEYLISNLIKEINEATKLGLNSLPVMISCSTDPLQSLENKKKHTLKVLKLLADNGFPLIIMTQNPNKLLGKEYLSIIRSNSTVVEVTIPSMDAGQSAKRKIFQTKAPTTKARFKAIKKLIGKGIPVRLRLDPIIPKLNGEGAEQSREEIFKIIEIFSNILRGVEKEEVKKEAMVICNVMVLTKEVIDKLGSLGMGREYQDFYEKNGKYYKREDGKEMLILNQEIQEKLLLPVFEAGREFKVPICTCVSDVHFYKTRSCIFPVDSLPFSIENDLGEEKIEKKIREKFPGTSIVKSEKRSLWAATRFLTEDLEFYSYLIRETFNSQEFKQAVKERKVKEFLNNGEFIKKKLKELLDLSEDEVNKLDFSHPTPILYWIFIPLLRMLKACSSYKDKIKPDMIWGALNFWDPFLNSHYATQFLHEDYFKPGDTIIFKRVINEWLLQPNNPYVLTLTELFLTHKTNRKVLVIQRSFSEEPPTFRNLYSKNIIVRILLSNEYENILEWLNKKKPKYEIKNKISQEKEINKIIEEYLNLLKNSEIQTNVSNFVNKLKEDLETSNDLIKPIKDKEELKKFLNELIIFDLVTPEVWKWIVIYPSLLYNGTPIGGVFLVLDRLLDVPIYRLLQHMITELFAVPQILIEKQLFLEQSLRSAVAAIMSRNMSHNIGSHVLNYLSNPEELNNLWII